MILPSASGLEAAIRCPPSTLLPQVRNHFDAADAGKWKHAFVAAIHNGVPYSKALEFVPEEYRFACSVMDLERILKMPNLVAEEAFAYDVVTGKARSLGVDIERVYETTENEIPMTLDYSGIDATGEEVICVDLKTGYSDVTPAARNWQVKVGALALARLYNVSEAKVALIKARHKMKPLWDVAHLDAFDLSDAANELAMLPFRLEAAEAMVLAGKTPQLNAGEWCRRCPARRSCPATSALIRETLGHPGKALWELKQLITPQNAAEAWARLKVLKGVVTEVEAHLRAYASETPFMLNEETILGPVVGESETIDGQIAWSILKKQHDEETADRGVALDASKASLERAVRPIWEAKVKAGEKTADGKKVTLTGLVNAALEEIKQAGGITTKEKVEVKEHRITADEKLALVMSTQEAAE